MSSSSSSSSSPIHWTSFVLGVATTAVVVWMLPLTADFIRQQEDQQQRSRQAGKKGDVPSPSTSTSADTNTTSRRLKSPTETDPPKSLAHMAGREDDNQRLLDAPDLDLRLIRKAEAVIRNRTGQNFIIVVERCTNDHNYSAILRTAEAMGVQHVWLIDPPPMTDGTTPAAVRSNQEIKRQEAGGGGIGGGATSTAKSTATSKQKQQKSDYVPALKLTDQELEGRRKHRLFAKNATEWLSIRDFATTKECIQALRHKSMGHDIWVTDLSQRAVPLTREALRRHYDHQSTSAELVLPERLAVVFGTEAVGCSQEMLNEADLRVYLPLRGFADSLNLSVATALVLHHILYVLQDPPSLLSYSGTETSTSSDGIRYFLGHMSESERRQLREIWFPKLAQSRLLTSSEKKKMRKIQTQIEQCHVLRAKKDAATSASATAEERNSHSALTPEQEEKLAKLTELEQQLRTMQDAALYGKDGSRNEGSVTADLATLYSSPIKRAVAEWIENPPDPLTDLRRADPHRISYVGKNTKKFHREHWKDMATVVGVEAAAEGTSSSSPTAKGATASAATGVTAKSLPNATARELRHRVRQEAERGRTDI